MKHILFTNTTYITVLFILIVNSICSFTSAQVSLDWVRTYQGPITGSGINVMTIDENDYIYVSGVSISSAVAYDIATIKYNKYGDSLWVRRYSSGSQCQVDDIAVDTDGNVYVTGFSVIGGQPVSITIKYSADGDVLWEKLFSNSEDNRSVGIGLDNMGFVYIAGVQNEISGNGWGYFALKFNPVNGDTIWTASYNYSSSSVDIAKAMAVDEDGNVYICGQTNADSLRSTLVKFNADGEIQWASHYKRPGISGEIFGEVLKLDKSGNIYFAGHCYNGPVNFVDYLVAKYNSNGTYEWIVTYTDTLANGNTNGIDEAYDLAIDDEGNVFVTGKSYKGGSGSNNYDYLTIKFSPDGNPLWKARYNNDSQGPTQDEALAIAIDPYGNSYVTGVSSKSHLFNNEGFATVKYDRNGTELWRIRHDEWWYCFGYAIALDSENMIYVGGRLTSQFGLLKYLQLTIPVELSSFNAVVNESSVELEWTTATEINNQGFQIQKFAASAGNNTWEEIGYVAGFGTTTETKKYTFVDDNVSNGVYLYRLKQIDYDGTFEYSDVIEVNLNFSPKKFALNQNYPNPFNPATTISFTLPVDSKVTLKIYNVLGEVIITLINNSFDAGLHNIEFNAQSLSSGIYLYKIEARGVDGTEMVSTRKMILNK